MGINSFSKVPNNVIGILLRSVFLGTMNEINWAFIDGPKTFAPNLYERFSGLFGKGKNLIESYYEKVVNQIPSFIHGFGMIMREYYHKSIQKNTF